MVGAVIGCIGGVVNEYADSLRELVLIMMGTNAAVYGSLCDGGGPGPGPQVGKACCTFTSIWTGSTWSESQKGSKT